MENEYRPVDLAQHRNAPLTLLEGAPGGDQLFHGIPFEIGPSKPYWGDGMGDALQWLGFALILACSAAVVGVARRRPSATLT